MSIHIDEITIKSPKEIYANDLSINIDEVAEEIDQLLIVISAMQANINDIYLNMHEMTVNNDGTLIKP